MFLWSNKLCVQPVGWYLNTWLRGVAPHCDWTVQEQPANKTLWVVGSASGTVHTVSNAQELCIRQELSESWTSLFSFYFVYQCLFTSRTKTFSQEGKTHEYKYVIKPIMKVVQVPLYCSTATHPAQRYGNTGMIAYSMERLVQIFFFLSCSQNAERVDRDVCAVGGQRPLIRACKYSRLNQWITAGS